MTINDALPLQGAGQQIARWFSRCRLCHLFVFLFDLFAGCAPPASFLEEGDDGPDEQGGRHQYGQYQTTHFMRHVHKEKNDEVGFVHARADHRQHIKRLAKAAVFAKRDAGDDMPFGKKCEQHLYDSDDAEQLQAVEHKFFLIFV